MNGAEVFGIPPDQRFYAGGGGTIRGFRYQSVGPQFPDGKPVGGTGIDVASLEVRQRFGESRGRWPSSMPGRSAARGRRSAA